MTRNFGSHDAIAASVQAAEGAWSRGDWARALDSYNEILRGRLEDLRDDRPLAETMRAIDLVVIERLADLAVLFGHFRAADRLLQGYVELTTGAGNLMASDYAALKRVRLALGAGQFNDALERLQEMGSSIGDVDEIRFESRALTSWESERRWRSLEPADQAVLYTRLYLELGRLLSGVGQYDDAIAALARGRHHAVPRAPDLARRAAVPLQLDEAAALLERGDLQAARSRLRELADRRGLRSQPDSAIRAAELNGKLALLTGELGEARRFYAEILRDCLARGFGHAALLATLNLAHVSIYLNQTATARDLLARAAEEAAALGDPLAAARAAYLMRLARARGTSLIDGVAIAPPVTGLWGWASPRSVPPAPQPARPDAIPAEAPQASNYLAFFEDMAVAFYARLADEGPRSAADSLDSMDAVFANTTSLLIRLRLLGLRGISAYYLGQYDQASVILEEVADGFSRLGLRPELWQILRVLGWCRVRRNRPREEVEGLSQQTQDLLDGMVGSLPAEDRAILMLTKWTGEEEFLASRIDALIREHRRVESSPWPLRTWRRWALWRQLDELLRFLDRYQDGLHRNALAVSRGPDAGPIAPPKPLWRRLVLHPRRRAILSFLVLPDRVFLACSRWGRIDFGVSPTTRLEVREKVGLWHDEVRDPELATSNVDRIADELAAALQLPVLLDRLPRRIDALTIVPDDSLHGFPFAAVRHKGGYLIHRFALSIGFDRDRPQRADVGRRARVGALLVGVSRGSDNIEPLPGVAPELDDMSRWLASRRVASRRVGDDQADRAGVIEALGNCRIAHLACHGVFEVDRPDGSGLVLIPEAGRVEILSIRDLAQLDLAGLHLVTLSACWSADNFVLPGRRVISLPETFYRAGTGSILGCLWPVNDRTVASLMRRFYENLGTMPRDQALRHAQLDFLNGRLKPDAAPQSEWHAGPSKAQAAIESSHPVSWAGFTISGDPGRLKLR